MKLYLLRHGKAVRDDEDRTRPLATRGRKQAVWLGEWLAERGFSVDRVLQSPLTRARQTAALVIGHVGLRHQPELTDGLMPSDDLEPWVERLAGEEEDLLLVGHNLFMEDLAEALTGEYLRFKTCTLAAFERQEDGSFVLLWSETPPRSVTG